MDLEELALIIKNGFERTDLRFDEVDKRFNEIDKRFDRIENMILTDHIRRIERLEKQVEELKDALAL